MGWTFKTSNEEPIIITPEKEEHNPDTGHYYDPDISYDNCGQDRLHPLTGEFIYRITVEEYNKLSGIKPMESLLMGNGFTGKQTTMDDRRAKALQKNPMHSTMNDYKTSNPDSLVSKSRKRNLKRMEKKNVNVLKNKTKIS